MRALDEGKGFRFTDEEVNFKGAERAIKKVAVVVSSPFNLWQECWVDCFKDQLLVSRNL